MQWAKASINKILLIDCRNYFSEYRTYGFEKEDYNSKRELRKKSSKDEGRRKQRGGKQGKKLKKTG